MVTELSTFPCPFEKGLCHCQICPDRKVLCISKKRKEEVEEFCGEDVLECVGFMPPKPPSKVDDADTN